MNLFYTQTAVDDLERLRVYLEQKSPEAARRAAHALLTQIERLVDFPSLGRPVQQAPDPESVRDLVFGNYIIRYTVHTRTIVLLRVWHHNEQRDD